MPGFSRFRAVPWVILFEAVRTVQGHVTDRLSPRERRRVNEILRSSRGRPQNVTPSEREELRRIAEKLELGQMARDLVPRLLQARTQGRHPRRW